MKRFISVIVLLLSLLLIMPGCSTREVKDDPEISLSFNLSTLTDEEYTYVGTKGLENPTKDDFKNIELTLAVKHSNNISNRKITVPDIQNILRAKGILWFGEQSSQDNSTEKFANYEKKYVIYTKGMDEKAIKNMFISSEVKISWTAKSGKTEEKVFKLNEIIQTKIVYPLFKRVK